MVHHCPPCLGKLIPSRITKPCRVYFFWSRQRWRCEFFGNKTMRLWEGQLLFPGIECPYRIREVMIDEEGQWETSPPPLCTPSSFNREGFTSECRNWQTILSNLLLKCKFDELLLLPKYYNKQKLHYKWHEWFNKVTESYCLQKILCTTLPRQLKVLGRCNVGIVFSILIIIVIVILHISCSWWTPGWAAELIAVALHR